MLIPYPFHELLMLTGYLSHEDLLWMQVQYAGSDLNNINSSVLIDVLSHVDAVLVDTALCGFVKLSSTFV